MLLRAFYLFGLIVLFSGCTEKDSNLPPSMFEVTVGVLNGNSVQISWEPAIDPDNGFVTYNVFLAGIEILHGTPLLSHSFSLNDISLSNIYYGKVVATDELGNRTESDFSFSTEKPSDFTLSTKYEGYSVAHIVWKKAKLPDGSNALFDVYLNNSHIMANTADTSVLISINHENAVKGLNSFSVIAKGPLLTTPKYGIFTFQDHLLLTEKNLILNVYNISDKRAEVLAGLKNLSSAVGYHLQRQRQPFFVYVNGVLHSSEIKCNSMSSQYFPTIDNLTPNTSYTIKVTLTNISFNTAYEPLPIASKEITFTTNSIPITNSFDLVQFENITSTSVDLSWRVLLYRQSCATCYDCNNRILIYLNGVLWHTLDKFATGYSLTGLSPNTDYTLKLVYIHNFNNPASIISSKEVVFTTK